MPNRYTGPCGQQGAHLLDRVVLAPLYVKSAKVVVEFAGVFTNQSRPGKRASTRTRRRPSSAPDRSPSGTRQGNARLPRTLGQRRGEHLQGKPLDALPRHPVTSAPGRPSRTAEPGPRSRRAERAGRVKTRRKISVRQTPLSTRTMSDAGVSKRRFAGLPQSSAWPTTRCGAGRLTTSLGIYVPIVVVRDEF